MCSPSVWHHAVTWGSLPRRRMCVQTSVCPSDLSCLDICLSLTLASAPTLAYMEGAAVFSFGFPFIVVVPFYRVCPARHQGSGNSSEHVRRLQRSFPKLDGLRLLVALPVSLSQYSGPSPLPAVSGACGQPQSRSRWPPPPPCHIARRSSSGLRLYPSACVHVPSSPHTDIFSSHHAGIYHLPAAQEGGEQSTIGYFTERERERERPVHIRFFFFFFYSMWL